MKKSIIRFYTGQMLQVYLTKERITLAELGRMVSRTRVAALGYTKKNTMQTATLLEICYALHHNFFQDISNSLPKTFTSTPVIDPEKQALENERHALVEQLLEENKVLKIQNELLMKIKM